MVRARCRGPGPLPVFAMAGVLGGCLGRRSRTDAGAAADDAGGGAGFAMATFRVAACTSQARRLGGRKFVHACLGRALYLVWDRTASTAPLSVAHFIRRRPTTVRLDRDWRGAELRLALQEEAEANKVVHTPRLLLVRGVEQSTVPGGLDRPALTLLLEAPSAVVAQTWAAAAAEVLLCPWPTLLSLESGGGEEAAARVQELRESLQPHLPPPSGGNTVAKALGPRGGRYVLNASDWLSLPSVAHTAATAAGAVDEAIKLPVGAVFHRLALLAVQAGALAVLQERCFERRADVTDQCMCVLNRLLEHIVLALRRDQTASCKAHVEQLSDVLGRLDAVLVAVEASFFADCSRFWGRSKGALLADLDGWEKEIGILKTKALDVCAQGASAQEVVVVAKTVSRLGDAIGGQQAGALSLSKYGARFDARGPDPNYVAGVSTPGRAERAIVSALQAYATGGGGEAPRLGVCGIGGSGKSTACIGVAACAFVRKQFSCGVAWVQLNDAVTAGTVVDAVVALVYRFCGEAAARRLLQLKEGDDLVGIAAGYVQAMPAAKARKCAKWLVIIDDVNIKKHHLLAQLLRVVPCATPVIFTTRVESVVASLACQRVSIDVLPSADARLLLAKLMGKHVVVGESPFSDAEEAAWVRRVVDKTKGHALSLHVVGRMIARRNGAWRPVMVALEKRWLDPEFAVPDDRLGVPLSVRASLDASLALLPDETSRSAFMVLGVLPTSVKVGVHVLGRLWRPLLNCAAVVDGPLVSCVHAGASGVAVGGCVDGLVDVLSHAGLLRHMTDDARGVVAGIVLHPVLDEYARLLLGDEFRAVHGRLVEDYMGSVGNCGPDTLGDRGYCFWRTADDGYFYDNVARHAAASQNLSMLLSLTCPQWATARVRTCSPLAYQADLEIVLTALLAVRHDMGHKVRRVPAQLFKLHLRLGWIYQRRIAASRASNVEAAVECYHRALAVRTREEAPLDWAAAQNDLGNAYLDRVLGDKAANMEEAVACYQRALEVRTRETVPQDWAMTQNNLGIAYGARVQGDRAANVEKSVACFTQALEVRTREAVSVQWAITQNDLGSAYRDRVHGDKAANVEEAVECYKRALEVRTREAAPLKWAATQHNMGNAYLDRVLGDKANNVEEAVACYERALSVRTREAAPLEWARTQSNMGNAYRDRLHGDKAANVEQAVACYKRALQVLTRETAPEDWAVAQSNLRTVCS